MKNITSMHLVKDAREFVRENLEEGVTCPCCGQFAKLYKRQINSTMAVLLIRLHKLSKRIKGYHHVSRLTGSKFTSGGDFSKLRYWGLIEEMPKDPNDESKKTSGMWKITDRGNSFVMGYLQVPKYKLVFNADVYDSAGDLVTIYDSLGESFNYKELMER